MNGGFENKMICERCGGDCCKKMPACAMPEDFPIRFDELLHILKTGKWAIDWLNKSTLMEPDGTEKGRAYFIRPAIKGKKNIFDNSKKGECVFLNKNGCELLFEERPIGCRLLEPKEDFNCVSHGADIKQSAISWLPFWELLEEAGRKVK